MIEQSSSSSIRRRKTTSLDPGSTSDLLQSMEPIPPPSIQPVVSCLGPPPPQPQQPEVDQILEITEDQFLQMMPQVPQYTERARDEEISVPFGKALDLISMSNAARPSMDPPDYSPPSEHTRQFIMRPPYSGTNGHVRSALTLNVANQSSAPGSVPVQYQRITRSMIR